MCECLRYPDERYGDSVHLCEACTAMWDDLEAAMAGPMGPAIYALIRYKDADVSSLLSGRPPLPEPEQPVIWRLPQS